MGGKVRKFIKTKSGGREPGLRLHRFSPTPYRYFALASGAFVFAFLAASVLMPVQVSDAQEVTVKNTRTGYYVTVTSADTVNLNVDATPTGALASAKDTVNIKTNVPSGYTLLISASSENLTSSGAKVFTPVSGTLDDPAVLSANTWGFSLDAQTTPTPAADSKWAALSTSVAEISSSDEQTSDAGDDVDVYYAVNATSKMPAGNYATTVTYTAVAEGTTPDEYLQEFTLEECVAMNVGETISLLDNRDQTPYGIVKAADGNCWFKDNLSYLVTESSTWNSNITDEPRLHVAENDGYVGEVYYNWTAANSACPVAWSLPTSSQWTALMSAYNLTTGADLLAETTLGFENYYGRWDWNQNSEYYQGSGGYFWSSTPSSEENAYFLWYASTTVNPQDNNTKGRGNTVRCVFTGQSSEQMQNFTVKMCENLAELASKTLVDRRNGETYRVVKAKDGHCWMADNLKLYGQTISAEDSNFTSGTFEIPSSTTWNTNVTDSARVHVATNSGYEGEVYYNWYAATAGSTESNTVVSVNTSICPKGWRLPINGDATQDLSSAALMSAHDLTTGAGLLNESALGFTKYYGSWRWDQNSEWEQGQNGYFWSATPYNTERAYLLIYYSTGISPQHNGSQKGQGFPIRCVFDDRTLSDLTYMQDITPDVCANTAESTKVTLLDKRGRGAAGGTSSGYGVVKAKDGNCWMTDNFDLYNKSVSAAESDFTGTGTFNIPNTSTWNSNVYNAAKVHKATNSGYTDQVYYNWCSAVALSNCATTAQQDQSICPKNWRLPINGDASTDKSYAKLMDSYGITTVAELFNESDLGFTSQYGDWDYSHGSESNQGSGSGFWASTPSGETQVYNLWNTVTQVRPQNIAYKGHGFSIRCVAR